MLGVSVNAAAIIVGTILGLFFKKLFTDQLSERIELALGYCTLIVGIRTALKFENVLVLIGCIAIGGLIGYWAQLETRIETSAKRVQQWLTSGKDQKFAEGLTVSSILFCVGGMAVLGSIQSGVLNQHDVLFTKALLDGIISISFASIYGFGVALSAVPVFLYQGSIALAASYAPVLNETRVINEISGVGGVLLTMVGINLTRLSRVPTGDFLPAIILVILVMCFGLA